MPDLLTQVQEGESIETLNAERPRALDVAIAENVFGMAWCRLNRRDTTAILRTPEQAAACWPAQEPDERIVESADNYSSSIEAAMQVVEKLRADRWIPTMVVVGRRWHTELFREGKTPQYNERAHGESESLPEAICLAALKALENK